MTNVKSTVAVLDKQDNPQPKQEVLPFEQVSDAAAIAGDAGAQVTVREDAPAQVFITIPQDVPDLRTLQQLWAQKINEIDMDSISGYERVATVLSHFPNISDRELGKLSKLLAATAKKHREALKRKP